MSGSESALRSGAPPARPPLDRRRILEAALRIIDEHGLGELTMRRLGAALGVQAMSLYGHVDGKQAVVEGVRELIFEKLAALRLVEPETDRWQDSVIAAADAFRDVCRAHPHAIPIYASDVDRAYAAAAPFLEPVLATMRRGGVPAETAQEYVRIVIRYVLATSALDLQGITSGNPLAAEERAALAARSPLVAGLVGSIETRPSGDLVEPGLRLLVRGMEEHLRDRRVDARAPAA